MAPWWPNSEPFLSTHRQKECSFMYIDLTTFHDDCSSWQSVIDWSQHMVCIWKVDNMSDYMFRMSSSFCVFRQTGNGIICMCCWYCKLLPVILLSLWLTFIEVVPLFKCVINRKRKKKYELKYCMPWVYPPRAAKPGKPHSVGMGITLPLLVSTC